MDTAFYEGRELQTYLETLKLRSDYLVIKWINFNSSIASNFSKRGKGDITLNNVTDHVQVSEKRMNIHLGKLKCSLVHPMALGALQDRSGSEPQSIIDYSLCFFCSILHPMEVIMTGQENFRRCSLQWKWWNCLMNSKLLKVVAALYLCRW